jgi:hypothetical protein
MTDLPALFFCATATSVAGLVARPRPSLAIRHQQ